MLETNCASLTPGKSRHGDIFPGAFIPVMCGPADDAVGGLAGQVVSWQTTSWWDWHGPVGGQPADDGVGGLAGYVSWLGERAGLTRRMTGLELGELRGM